MKIIIFGATGKTGLLLINQALDNGHYVTAFVRNSDKIIIKHDRLNVIVGSVQDSTQVADAICDQDAVISCLGGDNKKDSTILTDMTKTIVDAMKKNNIKRIAYTATAGIDNEIPGVIVNFIISLLLKNVIRDHKGAVDYIRNNDLDFTIARPLSLTDDSALKSYRAVLSGVPKGGRNISREDLAHFLLDSVENHNYINESVGLAY